MRRRKIHYALQSTRGFAACVEPTEDNAFTYHLTDIAVEVECRRCLRWLAERDAFARRARVRQEHGPTRPRRSAVPHGVR